jgi:hypothetical protein
MGARSYLAAFAVGAIGAAAVSYFAVVPYVTRHAAAEERIIAKYMLNKNAIAPDTEFPLDSKNDAVIIKDVGHSSYSDDVRVTYVVDVWPRFSHTLTFNPEIIEDYPQELRKRRDMEEKEAAIAKIREELKDEVENEYEAELRRRANIEYHLRHRDVLDHE